MAGTGSSKQVDPIAYRVEEQQQVDTPVTEQSTNWQFDASKLQNADVNLSKYGDDSSEANYNNPDLRGGENDKYKGENTRNTSVAYDKNATLENLNPNYAYGQKAQMVNSSDAGYIQRRNDQIASALYNAGKTSIQDVSDYLNQQTGFQNSTQNERNNTIASVWKRLGEIQGDSSSNGNQNENKTDTNKQVEDNSAVKNMESDLLKSTEGELYGKNTADSRGDDSAIKTLQDTYNVERAVNEQRIANFKDLQSSNSETVAFMLSEGKNIYSEQSMRDLMQYDPAKYQEIQNELKKIKGQNTIDQISLNGKVNATEQIEKDTDNVSSELNNFVNKTASERDADSLATSLSNVLSESEIVSSAIEQKEIYKRKIEDIQLAMDSLPTEARNAFKGDVPQYIVNAFVSNRMQQYNKELQKYQNLYNSSLDEIKWEASQAQRREEMDYKWQNMRADQDYKDANLKLQRDKFEYDKVATDMTNQINLIKNGQWNKDGSYSYINGSGKMVTIEKGDAINQTSVMLSNNADAFFSIWQQKMDNAQVIGDACYGGQCEQFTDNYANQFYGVTMVGEGHTYTTAEEKAGYANVFTPYKGVIAVWNYTSGTENMKKYGHTAVVMDYDPSTGDFTFMESNGDGKGTVGIRKANINTDGNLVGFRDPTKPSLKEQEENGIYNYYSTPMTNYFESAMEVAKTEGERGAITKAADAYSLLYELNDNGYINKIVKSDILQNIISSIDASTFAADGNDNGAAFFEQLPNYIRNKVKDDDYAHAINRLFRLIEVKLREESGAAINSAEWKSQFIRYLPQAGASEKLKRDNLRDLEKDTVYGRIPYNTEAKKYYKEIIPTQNSSEKSEKSELEQARDAIKDALKRQIEGK